MTILTPELLERLLANRRQRGADRVPVVKFFDPLGVGTRLAPELDADGDTLFGLSLRRTTVMGSRRVELEGFTDVVLDRLKAIGLLSEIVAWKLRLFIPTGANGPAILKTLLDRYPLRRVAERTAA